MASKSLESKSLDTRGSSARSLVHWPRWALIAAVVVIAVAASVMGLGNDFVNDDIALIANDARVHDLAHWRDWFTLPYWPAPFSPDLYRPVTTAMIAMEYVMGGGSPLAFRIASYLLYAACAVGVFELARRLMPVGAALAIAALFAAHPVHVEAVSLGVCQGELLVALIALVMCIRYIDRRRRDALTVRDWLLFALLYFVASLAKEVGLVLPALLVALEPLVERRRWKTLTGGLAGLAMVAVLVIVIRRQVLGELAGTFTAEALVGLGMGQRALTMLAVVPQWLRLLVWPAHLRADYSPQEFVASTSVGGDEVFGALLVVIAVVGCVASWRRAPLVSAGILWCAASIAPVSNVIVPTGILIAERTLFLPSIGFLLLVAGIAQLVLTGEPRAAAVSSRAPSHAPAIDSRLLYLAGGVLVALGVVRSGERQLVWRNQGYFVARAVKDAPLSFRAQEWFGDALFTVGETQMGYDAYRRAMNYVPRRSLWIVRNNLAEALDHKGDVEPAVEQWRASLAQRPSQVYTRGAVIVRELALGRYDVAKADADSGVAQNVNPVFLELRSLADSAQRVNAPVGSIRIALSPGLVTAIR